MPIIRVEQSLNKQSLSADGVFLSADEVFLSADEVFQTNDILLCLCRSFFTPVCVSFKIQTQYYSSLKYFLFLILVLQ